MTTVLLANATGTAAGGVLTSSATTLVQTITSLGITALTYLGPTIGTLAAYRGAAHVYELRTASSARESLTELTHKDEYRRLPKVYGRITELRQLVNMAQDNVTVVTGPSGIGKSSLMYGFVHYIKSHPDKQQAKVYKCSIRDLIGGRGVKDALTAFWTDSIGIKVRTLLNWLIEEKNKGHEVYLLLDEIHELLEKDRFIFEGYKAELSEGKIHIIGFTTEEDIINNVRAQPGLERRIERITLSEMEHDETLSMLRSIYDELLINNPELPRSASEDFFKTIFQGSRLYSTGKSPEAPSKLLRDFLKNFLLDNPNRDLNSAQVYAFLASIKGETAAILAQKAAGIDQHKNSIAFQRHIVRNPLPMTSWAENLQNSISNNPSTKRVISVPTNSVTMLCDALTISFPDMKVLRCDWNNSADLDYANFPNDYPLTFLVLENFPPSRISQLQALVLPGKETKMEYFPAVLVPSVISSGVNSTLRKVAGGAASMLPAQDGLTSFIEKVREGVAEKLLQYIAVCANSSYRCPLVIPTLNPSQSVETLPLARPTFNDELAWLKSKNSNYTDQELKRILFALHILAANQKFNPLDIMDRLINSETPLQLQNLSTCLSKALLGVCSEENVRHALKQVEKLMNCELLLSSKKSEVPRSSLIENQLFQLKAIEKSEPLILGAEGIAHQTLLKAQIAKVTSYQELDYALIKDLPPALKEIIVQDALSKITTDPFILDEMALSDPTLAPLCKNRKLICFRAIPTENRTLTPNEWQWIFQKALQNVDEQLQGPISKLYALYLTKTRKPFKAGIDLLKAHLKKTPPTNLETFYQSFINLYGTEVDLEINDLRYEVDPRTAGLLYRVKRLFNQAISTLWSSARAPFDSFYTKVSKSTAPEVVGTTGITLPFWLRWLNLRL